ncbi:MAG: glycosyltransferase [Campylobacterales bacterium]
MKILYLNHNDTHGGAAKGAYRLHRAFVKNGIDSKMLVKFKFTDDRSVEQYFLPYSKRHKMFNTYLRDDFYPRFSEQIGCVHSYNLKRTRVHELINKGDADVVIMHWIGDDTIGFKELAKIEKPIIWRQADMWSVCGCEHYIMDESDTRHRNGYQVAMPEEDVDAWVWHKKQKYLKDLKNNCTFVSGSHWLADIVKDNKLYRGCDSRVIPSGLDLSQFRPLDKKSAKKLIGIDHRKTILFGAHNALSDRRKGFDLLESALERLSSSMDCKDIQLLIFGSSSKGSGKLYGFDATYLGVIQNVEELVATYSASDVMVVPSRFDNLPFTAIEALACGTPVAGFEIGGMPDIIDSGVNGYLAKAFDVDDLSLGIQALLFEKKDREINEECVQKSKVFDISRQVKSYMELIDEIL